MLSGRLLLLILHRSLLDDRVLLLFRTADRSPFPKVCLSQTYQAKELNLHSTSDRRKIQAASTPGDTTAGTGATDR